MEVPSAHITSLSITGVLTVIKSRRSVEAVKVATVSNLAALVVNASLNYILIFGKLGLPAMGIRGAALATLIARLVEFSTAFVYMAFVDKRLRIRFRDFLRSAQRRTRRIPAKSI
mgnify:CR=1 FL=1